MLESDTVAEKGQRGDERLQAISKLLRQILQMPNIAIPLDSSHVQELPSDLVYADNSFCPPDLLFVLDRLVRLLLLR
jgi:hypothetical protein